MQEDDQNKGFLDTPGFENQPPRSSGRFFELTEEPTPQENAMALFEELLAGAEEQPMTAEEIFQDLLAPEPREGINLDPILDFAGDVVEHGPKIDFTTRGTEDTEFTNIEDRFEPGSRGDLPAPTTYMYDDIPRGGLSFGGEAYKRALRRFELYKSHPQSTVVGNVVEYKGARVPPPSYFNLLPGQQGIPVELRLGSGVASFAENVANLAGAGVEALSDTGPGRMLQHTLGGDGTGPIDVPELDFRTLNSGDRLVDNMTQEMVGYLVGSLPGRYAAGALSQQLNVGSKTTSVFKLIGGEVTGSLGISAEAGTLLTGPDALFPLLSGIEAEPGSPEYEHVFSARFNIMTDAIIAGTAIEGTARGIAAASKYGWGMTGGAMFGAFNTGSQEEYIVREMARHLSTVDGTPATQREAYENIKQLVEENKDVVIETPEFLAEDITFQLDTLNSLVAGIENGSIDKEHALNVIVRARQMLQGSLADADGAISRSGPQRQAQGFLDQSQEALGGRESVAAAAREAGNIAGERADLIELRKLQAIRMVENLEPAAIARAFRANENSAIVRALSSALDGTGFNFTAARDMSMNKLIDAFESVSRSMDETRNRLYANIVGGEVDVEGLSAIARSINTNQAGAFTLAYERVTGGPLRDLLEQMHIPKSRQQQGRPRSDGALDEADERLRKYLADNDITYADLVREIRPELITTIDSFATSTSTYERALGQQLIRLKEWIDGDATDFVIARDADTIAGDEFQFRNFDGDPDEMLAAADGPASGMGMFSDRPTFTVTADQKAEILEPYENLIEQIELDPDALDADLALAREIDEITSDAIDNGLTPGHLNRLEEISGIPARRPQDPPEAPLGTGTPEKYTGLMAVPPTREAVDLQTRTLSGYLRLNDQVKTLRIALRELMDQGEKIEWTRSLEEAIGMNESAFAMTRTQIGSTAQARSPEQLQALVRDLPRFIRQAREENTADQVALSNLRGDTGDQIKDMMTTLRGPSAEEVDLMARISDGERLMESLEETRLTAPLNQQTDLAAQINDVESELQPLYQELRQLGTKNDQEAIEGAMAFWEAYTARLKQTGRLADNDEMLEGAGLQVERELPLSEFAQRVRRFAPDVVEFIEDTMGLENARNNPASRAYEGFRRFRPDTDITQEEFAALYNPAVGRSPEEVPLFREPNTGSTEQANPAMPTPTGRDLSESRRQADLMIDAEAERIGPLDTPGRDIRARLEREKARSIDSEMRNLLGDESDEMLSDEGIPSRGSLSRDVRAALEENPNLSLDDLHAMFPEANRNSISGIMSRAGSQADTLVGRVRAFLNENPGSSVADLQAQFPDSPESTLRRYHSQNTTPATRPVPRIEQIRRFFREDPERINMTSRAIAETLGFNHSRAFDVDVSKARGTINMSDQRQGRIGSNPNTALGQARSYMESMDPETLRNMPLSQLGDEVGLARDVYPSLEDLRRLRENVLNPDEMLEDGDEFIPGIEGEDFLTAPTPGDAARQARDYYADTARFISEGPAEVINKARRATVDRTTASGMPFNETTFRATAETEMDGILSQNSNRRFADNLIEMLRRPESVADPEVVLDYMAADAMLTLGRNLKQITDVTDLTQDQVNSAFDTYSRLIAEHFPEEAAKVEDFVARLDDVRNERITWERLITEQEEAAEALKQTLYDNELRAFFQRQGVPFDNAYEGLDRLFKAQGAVGTDGTGGRVGDLMDLVDRENNPVLRRGIQSAFTRHARERIFSNQEAFGGGRNPKPAQLEQLQQETSNLLDVSREVFRDQPKFTEALEELTFLMGINTRASTARQVPMASPTAPLQQAREGLNRIIMGTMGPLTRSGARMRVGMGAIIDQMLNRDKFQRISNMVLSDPDMFIDILDRVIKKDFPQNEEAKALVYRYLLRSQMYTEDNEENRGLFDEFWNAHSGGTTELNQLLDESEAIFGEQQ